jgi:hypothetical protein
MTTKALRASRLPIRRGLSEAEAATFVGIGTTKFREMVAANVMPKPRLLKGVRCFDVDELNEAFDNAPREDSAETKDSWADFRGGNKT